MRHATETRGPPTWRFFVEVKVSTESSEQAYVHGPSQGRDANYSRAEGSASFYELN